MTRTEKLKPSLHPHCILQWSKLDPDVKLTPSVAIFRKKLLSIVRPLAKSVFGTRDPICSSHLSRLRVGLSKLNFYKLKHNFKDAVNALCPTNDVMEDTGDFL